VLLAGEKARTMHDSKTPADRGKGRFVGSKSCSTAPPSQWRQGALGVGAWGKKGTACSNLEPGNSDNHRKKTPISARNGDKIHKETRRIRGRIFSR